MFRQRASQTTKIGHLCTTEHYNNKATVSHPATISLVLDAHCSIKPTAEERYLLRVHNSQKNSNIYISNIPYALTILETLFCKRVESRKINQGPKFAKLIHVTGLTVQSYQID